MVESREKAHRDSVGLTLGGDRVGTVCTRGEEGRARQQLPGPVGLLLLFTSEPGSGEFSGGVVTTSGRCASRTISLYMTLQNAIVLPFAGGLREVFLLSALSELLELVGVPESHASEHIVSGAQLKQKRTEEA